MKWPVTIWLACLLGLVLLPFSAAADELRPGYLELREVAKGDWSVNWKQPLANPVDGPLPVPQLPKNCSYVDTPAAGVAAAAIIGSASAQCSGSIEGREVGMPGLLGQSDMLVRVQPLDAQAQALRLTAREPRASIATTPTTMQVLHTYFVLGVEHILAGWDHLLFVIALVLLVGRWRAVVLAATAFTVSHSITLAAASLGFVGLPQGPVEALIALSILFLALEILWADPDYPTFTQSYPWVVAFLFGLLHGFGFAGALNAIGLPGDDVPAALLAFNLGVEAGQLLVVALVLAMLLALRRWAASAYAPSVRVAVYAIGTISAYWLVDRVVA